MSPARILLPAALVVLMGFAATAELFVWVDDEGRTHVTDDPDSVPPGSVARGSQDEVGDLWAEGFRGPEPTRRSTRSGRHEERTRRLLQGAIEDLRRGESARAAAALEGVLRREPSRPEAHWYLALLDRQRGRFDSAERHLASFLAHAGDEYDTWRASAERRLQALRDERRLAEEQAAAGPLRLVAVESPHFRVSYDAQLGEASPDYARTVLRYLEEAHAFAQAELGVTPQEPTGVVLYAKAAYLAAHKHRFSFPTVGFFDGRIHVASAAHPAGELRAVLFHEYVHAVFTERTGGHRPFWLNEGLAELAERRSRQQDPLTRSERATLRRWIEGKRWIPLRRLAPGFGGLAEAEARMAYLQSTAAVDWFTSGPGRGRVRELLDAIGSGRALDKALHGISGLDTVALESALRRDILGEFPANGAL